MCKDVLGPLRPGSVNSMIVVLSRPFANGLLVVANTSNRNFSGLLPAVAATGDRETIDLALGRFIWNRWTQRSLVLAVGTSALLKLGDPQAAKTMAREALEAFLQVTDGSVTPNVLPHLIPVLVAVGDGDGLVRLSEMPVRKWPYAREWGPGVRLLLPALARLGLDDVRPRPYQTFLREKSYFDQSQVDLAAVYAERGLYDRAVAAADEARAPEGSSRGSRSRR